MPGDQFLEKLNSKSNLELERIAADSRSYIFDARHAAAILLKNRNYQSPLIEIVEGEAKKGGIVKTKNLENLKEEKRRLIRHLREISINGTGKYRLTNGNELQIKRLNEKIFQINIETSYGRGLGPVIICKIKDDSTYLTYPFLYLKYILIYGVGGVVLFILLSWLGYVNYSLKIFFIPFIVPVGFQLLLMPFIYFLTLKTFQERLKKNKNRNFGYENF
ncbi:hypothetical protein [Algoriphagus yeomjeoni]|uniref:Uncharacterized protein n=1 Tax=Algoriphagus yeomjeoni TaxID=291403 RepID=A0A327P780_9BACT|nr:hypothetical protein [Algoriphagus yeomjeoni]RAI85766.1 hypothetical protein LV83_03542 [Algoriphagus yeomjeoni]